MAYVDGRPKSYDSSKDGPVRYFTPDSTGFKRKLRAKLQERIAEHVGFLVGNAASDYADYRFRCGQISALHEAIEMCDIVEKEEER